MANHALGHMMYIAGRAHCLHVYHTHFASVEPEQSACRESRCYIYIIMKTFFPPLGYHTMDLPQSYTLGHTMYEFAVDQL